MLLPNTISLSLRVCYKGIETEKGDSMISSLRSVLFGAIFVLASAHSGNARNFMKITRGVEKNYSENSIHFYRPDRGVPVPEPKVNKPELGWIELGQKTEIACQITIAPDASVTEETAARELSAQIAYLVGTDKRPEILRDIEIASAPTVLVLGVGPEMFQGIQMDVPLKNEGFALKTGQLQERDILFIQGRDRFGVYWGVQTVKQMLFQEKDPSKHGSIPPEEQGRGRVLFPKGYFADWPDVQYRAAPSVLQGSLKYGRLNTRAFGAVLRKGSEIRLKTEAELRAEIAETENLGAIAVPVIGWSFFDRALRDDTNRTDYSLPSREFCPIKDLPMIEALVKTVFEAGAGGISINFDDIEALSKHHEKCPICKTQFNDAAEWQAFVLERVYSVAKQNSWHDLLFICCPTPYYNLRIKSDEHLKAYFSKLCGFPGAEIFQFYHTAFTRMDRKRLADVGLINYSWWNNGCWNASKELVGYDVGHVRMEFSWGLSSLSEDGNLDFFPERLAELRHLQNNTDLIFTGAGGAIGPAIGSLYGWDAQRFLFREEEYYSWYYNNTMGLGSADFDRVWEWALMPMAIRSIAGGRVDKYDERRMEVAQLAAELANTIRQPHTQKSVRRYHGPRLKTPETIIEVLKNQTEFLNAYNEAEGKLENVALFERQNGCLFSLSPETLRRTEAVGSTEIQTWRSSDDFTLDGLAFIPSKGNEPAQLTADNHDIGFLEMKNIDIDVTNFELLVIPCLLSRGSRLTAKVMVDGRERTSQVTSHGEQWLELVVSVEGHKLDYLKLVLDVDPAMEKPAHERTLLLQSVLLLEGQNAVDTVRLNKGAPVTFAEFDGEKFFRFQDNKLQASSKRFELSRQSFTIEAELIPMKVDSFKIAGTRATSIRSYTGLPGWALGFSFGYPAFTMEDKDGVLSTVWFTGNLGQAARQRQWPYKFFHIVAVRDFENRTLRLYVNGESVETEEKGSGVFGDEYSSLGISFDPWPANSMHGLVRSINIYNRAFTKEETLTSYKKASGLNASSAQNR